MSLSDRSAGSADGRARDLRAFLPEQAGQAWSFIGRHRRQFPSGVLVEEREVLAIEALLQLGRVAEAERPLEKPWDVLRPVPWRALS